MDNRQHEHAPEHYIPTFDEAEEALNPHDVAMAAVSGEIHQSSFPLPAYMPMTGNSHAHDHEPVSFFFPASVSENLMATTVSTYDFHHAHGSESVAYPADHSWQHHGHHPAFSHTSTEAGPTYTLSNTFGYLPYDAEQQHGFQTGTLPSSFNDGFTAPANHEQQTAYVYDWNEQGVQAAEDSPASVFLQPGHGSTSMSPIGTESGAHTPSSFASTSSAGRHSSMYAGTANIDSQLANTTENETALAPRSGAGEGTSTSRRGRARQRPTHGSRSRARADTDTASSAMISSSSGESSLSGAGQSRRGGRGMPRPHTLAESSYRERLNTRFNELKSALPPSSGTLVATGSGFGGGGQARAGAGVAERQPSKADVLEMARHRIEELERRRDSLARETKELKSTSRRLEQICAGQPLSQGQAGDSQLSPEDDEEEDDMED